MILVRGCPFPEHLLYDVENHVWYERLEDGAFRIGMTAVAVALAGEVLAFTPRRVGRPVEAGRACATVESGKWIGPARICFDGVVEAVNEPMIERPYLANQDCYGIGWMLVARPDDDAPIAALVSGNAIAEAYEAWMARENFPGCAPDGTAIITES
jgi:glycine cleavage system H protein